MSFSEFTLLILIWLLLIVAGFKFSVLLFDVLYFLIVSVLERNLFHLFI